MKQPKLRFVTQQLGSKSLKDLANALSQKLGYKVWRSKTPRPGRTNVQYGDGVCKIAQYEYFKSQGIPALPFTTSQEEAKEWLSSDPKTILFARTLTRASEGKGIVVLEQESPWVVAPVYTRYLKKKREYRVHIFNGVVVTILEKRKKKETESFSLIRNLANGYVFCSDAVIEPPGLRELALQASKVTSSTFAGVDIGFNEKLNELFVIEVNSAPGIQGTNISRYVDVICANV